MADGIQFEEEDLLYGLEGLKKADLLVRMLAQQGGLKFQNYARKNRRWTDRTGQARQRLTGGVQNIPTGYRIYLAHGVDYGIWLELAHEKRFSIIPETIQYVGKNEIMPGFNRLMERLGSV